MCKSFSIIVTSDVHGELGRFLTVAEHIRQKKPDVLLDNGDFLQGGMTHMYDTLYNKRSTLIDIANELCYDALIFGNHEFNERPERLAKLRAQANFPWISCNLGDFAQPYIVKEVRGIRILVLGVTTHFTPIWDEHGYARHIMFYEAATSVKKQLPSIIERERPDFVIVSYHGGFERDPNGAWVFDDGSGENEAEQLLQIEGIDLLITGHQHMQLVGTKNGVTYIQPGAHSYAYGEILVQQQQNGWIVKPKLQHITEEQPLPAHVEEWLNEPIATLPMSYTYDGLLDVMQHGHRYVDYVHAFQRAVTGADISVTELFFHEQGGLPQHVMRRDILAAYSRENALVTLQMTGASILAAIEQSAAVLAVNEAGNIDYAVNVYPNTLQPYQFDFFGGITYTCDVHQPVGHRITNVYVQQVPLQLERTYTVAVNSFRALGNAPYTMYKDATELARTTVYMPQLFEAYIREQARKD